MTDPLAPELDDRSQGGIQVIARMSAILRALSAHGQVGGMSLGAIAAQVELPRSTVQRIITALVAQNMVEPAGPTGFRMGPALGQMLYQTHSDIVPVLKPHVEQLSIKLQETVCLARLQMRKLHIVDAVIGEQVLRVVPQLGITPPLQITAPGKALLARMDDRSVLEWLRSEPDFERIDTTALLSEIAQVRAQGYAMDSDEVVTGVCAMAIAIDTYRGAYAVMILAPSVRMQRQCGAFQQELFQLRDAMEQLLGSPAACA